MTRTRNTPETSQTPETRTRTRRRRGRVVVLVAGGVTAAATVAVTVAVMVAPMRAAVLVPVDQAVSTVASWAGGSGSGTDNALGAAGGAVPDGTTPFDDDVPGVAQLDGDLRGALRTAALVARRDGVTLQVTSGWRSPAYQDHLLQEAVSRYGTEEEAARWVATSTTSLHVSGDAVDIGPYDAIAWLDEHGADHGLCPVYANEPWHYELRPDAPETGCPATYADPTADPRLQD